MTEIQIQPLYSLKDLRTVFNRKSNVGVLSLLENLNIPVHLVANKCIVYLNDIQTHAPELYASMLECNNINYYKKEKEEIDYSVVKNQFLIQD